MATAEAVVDQVADLAAAVEPMSSLQIKVPGMWVNKNCTRCRAPTIAKPQQSCHRSHANFTRVFCRTSYVRSAAEALWLDEGRALRKTLSASIRDCYGHAEHCRRWANEQSDPLLRQDFLDCERRWLLLARGYELAERMEALSKGLPPRKQIKVAA